MMTKNTQLNFGTVEELCKENFYISFYQRGYRWREEQVRQLLDDLQNFQPSDEVPSYFLQVLIRSPRTVKNEKVLQWNIVDGQQRLTTIGLILQEYDPSFRIRLEYDRDGMAALDRHFIEAAVKTIQDWLLINSSSRAHVFGTLKKAFFLLYDLPIIQDETQRNDEENQIFSDVNDNKLLARDSELVKCILLTPQNDEPVELTKRRAVEWDEMERMLQDDNFFAFLTPRNAADQDDRMTRLFLAAGIVPEDEDRKKTTFPYLSAFLRKNHEISSRREIWEKIADSFSRIRGWYRDNTAYHAVGWYLHQSKESINSFEIKKVRTAIDKIATEFDTARDNHDLYKSNKNLANRILFLFNCAYAWRTEHTRYDFRRHNLVDAWSLEHMRATNIRPQDKETFETYISACPEDKRGDFTYENYTKANNEQRGEAFLSEHLGEDEYPRDEDHSLGNLALLPKNPNSSLNNKLFRAKREEVLKWYFGLRADYFVPPATMAVFAKLFSGMEKETPHLSFDDKNAYLEFMKETISFFSESVKNVY